MMDTPKEQPTSPASSTDTISDTHQLSTPTEKLYPASSSSSTNGSPVSWTAHLSTSLSAIADQLESASRAISQYPAEHVRPTNEETSSDQPDTAALAMRLDAIERSQAALSSEIEALQNPQIQMESAATASTQDPKVAELEKRLNEAFDTIKLEQDRLYARLHNARVTVSKLPIMAPLTASGKPPPNFPATRGEFEHVTKERYEAILKSYGLPVSGDTNAKREAVRVFIGLPV